MAHACENIVGRERKAGWPWWGGTAVALAAGAILGISLLQGGEVAGRPAWLRWVIAGVALLPWLLQIRRPLRRGVLETVTLGSVAWLGWHHGAGAEWFLLIIAACESIVLWGVGTGVATGAVALGVVTGTAVTDPTGASNWVGWYLGTVAGVVGGWAVQRQRALVDELRSAQAELTRQSALGERQRIAREIHDVIAHSLTVTMLHLTAARLAVRSDPEEAEEALREAERVGRQSLADVRRTVDLLGSARDDGEPVPAPLPGAPDIAALVSQLAGAGLDARLVMRGDPSAVAPAAGLGLYRIAQESLANAVKHAPGAPVVVELDVNAESVWLRVCNGPTTAGPGSLVAPPPRGGFGLDGMAQRAALLGGSLQAGPDGAGWEVSVRVPGSAAGAPTELLS